MSEDFLNLEKKPSTDTNKEFSVSVLILIIVLLIVGGFVFFREHNGSQMLSKITGAVENEEEKVLYSEEEISYMAEETANENEEVLTKKIIGRSEGSVIAEEETVSVAVRSGQAYKRVVQGGEGLTHIAREAIKEYLTESSINLSAEEKVYMEDYIQRRIPLENEEERFDRWLEVGEEIEVSTELIEEALEKAFELTPQEIENLQLYALLVYFSS